MLKGKLTPGGGLRGRIGSTGSLTGSLMASGGGGIPYTGEYEFTPTRSTQTIHIAGMTPAEDITINSIPQNYGLITWNGAGIKVS